MKQESELRRETLFALEHYHEYMRMVRDYETPTPKTRLCVSAKSTGMHSDPTANKALQNLDPPKYIKRIKRWIWAIDQAHAYFQEQLPQHAELMEMLFGLGGAKKECVNGMKRKSIMEYLIISQTTLYRWREDIFQYVMLMAVQAGAVQPVPEQAQELAGL